jgi:hypothetical protein
VVDDEPSAGNYVLAVEFAGLDRWHADIRSVLEVLIEHYEAGARDLLGAVGDSLQEILDVFDAREHPTGVEHVRERGQPLS